MKIQGVLALFAIWGLSTSQAPASPKTSQSIPRTAIDRIIGASQANGPNLGYEANLTEKHVTSLVGVTGSADDLNRFDQVLIYRYELPTLAAGKAIEAFHFQFQIESLRDHAQQGFRLAVHLLNTDNPREQHSRFYFSGENVSPTLASFVGDTTIASADKRGDIKLAPSVSIDFFVDSGAALKLLQSFYQKGPKPTQKYAYFLFSLDQSLQTEKDRPSLTGFSLNRFYINPDPSTSNFVVITTP